MAHTTPVGQAHISTRLVPIALLIGLLSLISLSAAGQRAITVLHEGNSTFIYFDDAVDWDAVMDLAQDNDTIILPGGSIQVYDPIAISKPIVLIGAGYDIQGALVTQPTVITDYASYGFTIDHNVIGVGIHGIRFERNVTHQLGSSSIHYTRCEFVGGFSLNYASYNAATNLQIRECIFHQGITNNANNGTQGLSIYNSILDGGLNCGSGISSAIVDHCTLLGPGLSGSVNEGVSYNSCAFTKSSGALTINEGACFQNCLFVLGNSSTVNPNQCYTGQGNYVINAATALDFENVPVISFEQFSFAHDYHFASGSQGLIMGVGIYGGLVPFKPQGIPFNPHWEVLNVPPLTQGGVLAPTVITGEAQSY